MQIFPINIIIDKTQKSKRHSGRHSHECHIPYIFVTLVEVKCYGNLVRLSIFFKLII
jgi:hypothetical protein